MALHMALFSKIALTEPHSAEQAEDKVDYKSCLLSFPAIDTTSPQNPDRDTQTMRPYIFVVFFHFGC